MYNKIYDNQLDWKGLLIWVTYFVGFTCLVFAVFYALAVIFNHPVTDFQWLQYYYKDILILIIGIPLFYSVFLISENKNSYRIIDDNLIVKEYLFFCKTIDIIIPITTINKISLTRTFNHPRKHIQLQVGNSVYDLSCTTYRNELYKDIITKIKQ